MYPPRIYYIQSLSHFLHRTHRPMKPMFHPSEAQRQKGRQTQSQRPHTWEIPVVATSTGLDSRGCLHTCCNPLMLPAKRKGNRSGRMNVHEVSASSGLNLLSRGGIDVYGRNEVRTVSEVLFSASFKKKKNQNT